MSEKGEDKLVFALDIGTRSVIGIAGYQRDSMFYVRCTEREEYKSRAVSDGQIEDIAHVALIAGIVKSRMEEKLGQPLKNVHIAAAGRALKTVEASGEMEISISDTITKELITKLELAAVQQAYEQLSQELTQDHVFFCVGYVAKNYKLDGYSFSNLLGHKGTTAQVSLIVTFLPKAVVESLYATMERIDLTVSGLTLEPIAAMNAIIPTDLRKLNLALCDIGAGTSDIAVCDMGSISSYTMATIAGDEITEAIMQACLTDFQTAELIKFKLADSLENTVSYQNILGIECEEAAQWIYDSVQDVVESLARTISEKIIEINTRTPAAVFLVGGGSQTPMLHKLVAKYLGVDTGLVAVGGSVHIKKIVQSETNIFGPEYATPLGIALTAAQQSSADTFVVTINDEKLHLLNSWDTSVLGVLQMGGYRYNQIMGRNGKSITYSLNGERKTMHGGLPVPSEVLLNGKDATLTNMVTPGDVLLFIPVEHGADAQIAVGQIAGEGQLILILLEGEPFVAGLVMMINDVHATADTQIKNGDTVEIQKTRTLEELCAYLNIDSNMYEIMVNNTEQEASYTLISDDEVRMILRQIPSASAPQQEEEKQHKVEPVKVELKSDLTQQHENVYNEVVEVKNKIAEKSIDIILNGSIISLEPKTSGSPYQFFDLLTFTDIDPKNPKGDIVQMLNGKSTSYLANLQDGDKADIYWKSSKFKPN